MCHHKIFSVKLLDTGRELNVYKTLEDVLDVLRTFMYVQFIPCAQGELLPQAIVLFSLYRNIHFSIWVGE